MFQKITFLLAATLLAILLAACGGGSRVTTPANAPARANATGTTTGGVISSGTATSTTTGATTGTTGGTVHVGASAFVQNSVTINKGQGLQIVNDSPITHTILNGSWVNGKSEPAKESGAPTVRQVLNGTSSTTIGPFNTAGTFHLYATDHPGMNLTVIVR